jgi:hypothetical protein
MAVGVLTLNRFNGQEQFSVSEARIFQSEDDGIFELNFDIETDEKPIKTLSDTKDLNARPNAEFIVRLKNFAWNDLVGKCFTIPQGYNEETDEYLTRLYYCEHEGTNDNVIEIIGRNNDDFHVNIKASCTDVNHYDNSKPRTKIEIDAWFKAQIY